MSFQQTSLDSRSWCVNVCKKVGTALELSFLLSSYWSSEKWTYWQTSWQVSLILETKCTMHSKLRYTKLVVVRPKLIKNRWLFTIHYYNNKNFKKKWKLCRLTKFDEIQVFETGFDTGCLHRAYGVNFWPSDQEKPNSKIERNKPIV